MAVRILYDQNNDMAALYCSTSDVVFGPVFYADDERGVDAAERAQAFLNWFADAADYAKYEKTQIGSRRDVRCLTESALMQAYSDWRAVELAMEDK